MREIKFKAWLPGISKMTYSHTLEELMNWDTKKEDNGTAIWLQYTGLKDKSGIEIFEGDIWKRKLHYDESCIPKNKPFIESVSPIVYKHAQFEPSDYEQRRYPYSTTYGNWWEHGEVIGNIYENSDLLEVTP